MADYIKMTITKPDGSEQSYWTQPGKTVWEAMEIIGWDTMGSCGGMGTCSKCKFRMSGQLSQLSDSEREKLIPEEIRNGHRLACMAIMEGDFDLYIDYWPGESEAKTDLFEHQSKTGGNSHFFNKEFFIPGLEKETPVPIYDRIHRALNNYRMELTADNLNYLGGLDRLGRPAMELWATIIDGKAIKIGRQREKILGLALDIGSTSLFAALIDLEDGKITAIASHGNMQRIYGDDIISRVNYVREHQDGLAVMQRILINNIDSMVGKMLAESGANPTDIYKAAAVGNPVMMHFLAGVTTAGFEKAPYTGNFSDELNLSLRDLGLNGSPYARITILPQLGGFVGADTTACLLTLKPYLDKTFLLLDIGTNGEIVLGHQGRMWAASAAAGPAFEGGTITCGMRASQGAVDKVIWEENQIDLRTIGGGIPRGICGSGIIDLLAILLNNDFIDRQGTFTPKAESVFSMKKGKRGPEIILNHNQRTSSNDPLVFNQEDIRQVQLARSAIRTAVELLMQKAGIQARHLQNVFLAGVFGSYLDPANLMSSGLIPGVSIEKVRNIGNAAAQGAIMALLSPEKLAETDRLKSTVEYVELAALDEFQALFLKNIDF